MSLCRKNSQLVLLALIALSYYLLLTPTLAKANALTEAKQSIDELEHKLDAADAADTLNANANAPLHNPSRMGGYFGAGVGAAAGSKRSQRSLYGIGTHRLQISRSKIPIELDLLVENNDDNDPRTKRFDDYGHMRFGKRGGEDQFDDYGHMRFGRK